LVSEEVTDSAECSRPKAVKGERYNPRVLRFASAVIVSAALILAGPVIGQIRSALQSAFPGQYQTILVFAVGACAAVAVVAAVARMRDRRVARLTALAGALAIALAYSLLAGTGDPAVDAVERFHFVEYGVITLLFYFAWRPIPDVSRLILPVLAGLIVGTLEEWLQWFVPARVGEVRDIFLNLWAILGGLLFSIAIDPPAQLRLSVTSGSWRRVRRVSALALAVFALFFHFAHLGYEIRDGSGWTFRSAYSEKALVDVARERTERWRSDPPLTWSRYSREDQYFSEGIALVRRRNRCWDAGDVLCAWETNQILERYYAPVIDTASYVSATGLRWPTEQRDDAARRATNGSGNAVTIADDSIIYTWSKTLFWAITVAAVALLALL
jgi:VanZ family protein